MSRKKGGYGALVGSLELEPEKKAVALMYDRVRAPIVKAKGEGELADDIVSLAQEHGIYVAEDPALAETLSNLELNQEIPESIYTSIAVILSWAYWLRGETPD